MYVCTYSMYMRFEKHAECHKGHSSSLGLSTRVRASGCQLPNLDTSPPRDVLKLALLSLNGLKLSIL